MTYNYLDMVMEMLGYLGFTAMGLLFGSLIFDAIRSDRAETRFKKMMPALLSRMEDDGFMLRDHDIKEFYFKEFDGIPPTVLNEWKAVLAKYEIRVVENTGLRPSNMHRPYDTHIALYGNHYVTFTPTKPVKEPKAKRRFFGAGRFQQ